MQSNRLVPKQFHSLKTFLFYDPENVDNLVETSWFPSKGSSGVFVKWMASIWASLTWFFNSEMRNTIYYLVGWLKNHAVCYRFDMLCTFRP